MTLVAGTRLAHYEILEPIDTVGMGLAETSDTPAFQSAHRNRAVLPVEMELPSIPYGRAFRQMEPG